MEINKDGLTIFHMDDGADWAVYLRNTLSADKYNIHCSMESMQACSSQHLECKLKLFLVSPAFVEKENSNIFNESSFSFTDTCIFVLLGVEKTELDKTIEAVGITNDTWTVLEATEDPKVFRKMLVTIIELYESLHADENVFGDSTDHVSSDDLEKRVSGASDNSSSNRDSVESSGEPIYQTPPRARQVIRVRKVLTEIKNNSDDVYLLLDEETEEPLEIIRDDGLLLDAEVIRKVIYKVKIPDDDAGIDYDSIKVGTETSGYDDLSIRQSSSMKRLQDILTSQVNPISYMCSAFGVSENNLQEMDTKLAAAFRKFWPPQMAHCFYFLDDTFVLDEKKQDSKWPTALHFAAEFKLEKVASALLEIPGMVSACCLKNINSEYPHDIATRTHCATIRKMIESLLENHKRRLDGHDSGFADKTIFENITGSVYMAMENLKQDSSVYTHLQNKRRSSENDGGSESISEESYSALSSPTSPEPPDVTTIPSVKESTRESKIRERTLSEGDTGGKKTKRSQSLKSSIVAALGNIRKRRPSVQTSLEKSLSSSGKVYTRTESNVSTSRGRKKSSGSMPTASSATGNVPRDSGSFSEEESQEGAGQRVPSALKTKKQKRRKSVRIQRAMKETPCDLPSMPLYSNDPSFNIQI